MRFVAVILVATLVGAALGCGNEDVVAPATPTIPGEATLDLHEDVAPLDEPTYANVAKLLRGDPANDMDSGLCAYSGCHSGPGKAGLTFRGAGALDETLVYKGLVEGAVGAGPVGPRLACEYHPLRRVEPGDPSKSWLYIKLAGEVDADDKLNLVAADDWDDTMSPCKNTFPGSLMPFSEGEPVYPLEPAELRMIAAWIEDGAPGPTAP